MKLLYVYIKRFRNIVEQEVCFSDEYTVLLQNNHLLIRKKEPNPNVAYVYGDGFLKDVRVIVGKTGSGKTNFLQLLGMDNIERSSKADRDAYMMLYKSREKNVFVAEIVGLEIDGLSKYKKTPFLCGKNIGGVQFQYDFENNVVRDAKELTIRGFEETYIINSFDKHSFAWYDSEEGRNTETRPSDGLIPRMIVDWGQGNVSMETEFLRSFVMQFGEECIKRHVALAISNKNWRYKLKDKIPNGIKERNYWTYSDSIDSPDRLKNTTPKQRFLHDLLMDYLIYLRKWAYHVDRSNKPLYGFVYLGIADIRKLPDSPHEAHLDLKERINWLCQHLDYYTDEIHGNRGLLWQIGLDIVDIYDELSKVDEKYFTDDMLLIPVTDIDTREGQPLAELYERMDQYRKDEELGLFKDALLPYHWTNVSSGEFQATRIWGMVDKFAVRVKVMAGTDYEHAIHPNMILLLDEPENYMHPEMCRMFIKQMAEYLKQRGNDSQLQVIMSTHSPFMLSDVMSNQVVRMDYDENGYCRINQVYNKPHFAANIHTIMADSFFLKETIGEFAREFLTTKFEWLKQMEAKGELTDEERQEARRLRKLVPEIGDEMIRYGFIRMLDIIDA